MDTKRYQINTLVELRAFATMLAAKLPIARLKTNTATVLALRGQLGAGKTTFVQCLARAFKIKKAITSPTFLILQKYRLSAQAQHASKSEKMPFNWLYHIDCYRLNGPGELTRLGFEQLLVGPQLVVIEWAEKIQTLLPAHTIWLDFKPKTAPRREIVLKWPKP